MTRKFLAIAAAVIGGALGLVLVLDPSGPNVVSFAGGGLLALAAAIVLMVA